MRYSYGKQTIQKDDVDAVVRTLKSDWLTQGPAVRIFEESVARYVNVRYAVAVANGTAALHLAVLALELEPGFEGITSTLSFAASANCVLYGQGNAKLVDVDRDTALMDLDQLEEKISINTKVVIPVHYAGQSCDMRRVRKIAGKHNAYVIEDAAHAIGSEYRKRKVGSCQYSDMTVFSFHPVKTITSGEGGMITTNNKKLYAKLLLLRTHGITKDPKCLKKKNPEPWWYEMHSLGFNYRLTDLQAALGQNQMKKLERFKKKRRKIVEYYRKRSASSEFITIVNERTESNACWHLCPALIDFDKLKITKRKFFERLQKKNVNLQVHYIPIHKQPYYRNLGFSDHDYPGANQFYEKEVSLPCYPSLSILDVGQVYNIIVSELEN
ncbi:UDP-4-amino-4,6-dideoxy-N-acetyl-beta-L-altrosamine transaminase [Pseudomonadota bacterium]